MGYDSFSSYTVLRPLRHPPFFRLTSLLLLLFPSLLSPSIAINIAVGWTPDSFFLRSSFSLFRPTEKVEPVPHLLSEKVLILTKKRTVHFSSAIVHLKFYLFLSSLIKWADRVGLGLTRSTVTVMVDLRGRKIFKVFNQEFIVNERYNVTKELGQGAYGIVW